MMRGTVKPTHDKQMTKRQAERWIRSDEFYAASRKAYPYGFDPDQETDLEKISILGDIFDRTRKRWREVYDSATGEGWDQPDRLRDFHAACNAECNADDSVRENCFEPESLAYFQSCFSAFEGYED
jgi:hypothetical protein